MRKKLFVWALVMAVSMAFLSAGIVQQKTEDTAKDPVCGMSVKKSEAKATFEYKGATYYFCSSGCKEAFVKDPEKYLAKAEQKSVPAEMAGMHQHGKMMPHGKMSASDNPCGESCPLHSADVEMKTENLIDGVAVKYTSKNPETVKKIQKHLAQMEGGCSGCGTCPFQGQVKK